MNATPTHEELRELAYRFWEERGRPYGSPEVDWQRAEEEMERRRPTGSERPDDIAGRR
jgi:hypothetical protein